MSDEATLAVVVSYNGLDKAARTVAALRGQATRVLVVDNGSDAASLAVLDVLERAGDAEVTRLGANRGIGHALNVGVRRARETGCAWLLTMDQDSIVEQGMLAAYRDAVRSDPALVCLTPGNREGRPLPGAPEPVSYAVTSGNLVRADLYEQIGMYDEDLFIDCVDFDFSLRVRRAGHDIHRVPAAAMRHQLGDELPGGGPLRMLYALHSPLRRYYMYRNYMYLLERYLLRFPLFIVKLGLLQLILLPLIGAYDPKPWKSYRAVLRGFGDWLARRHGPFAERAR